MDIQKNLEDLSKAEQKRFANVLTDRLYCRHWCKDNGINYSNPDIDQAREILYNQIYCKK